MSNVQIDKHINIRRRTEKNNCPKDIRQVIGKKEDANINRIQYKYNF